MTNELNAMSSPHYSRMRAIEKRARWSEAMGRFGMAHGDFRSIRSFALHSLMFASHFSIGTTSSVFL
jgi:hypothetical protein